MRSDLYVEANKIWKRLNMGDKEEELKFDIEVYRKLLNFFMAGDYYYYIFDVKNGVFDFVSADITAVLGYPVEDITVPFFINNIHPEDQPWFLNFEHKVTEFFSTLTLEQIPNYKVRYDYRIRKSNGEYIRILQQVVTIQYDSHNLALRTFGVHTDISHLKKTGQPVMSFIGLNGEPSYIDVQVEQRFNTDTPGLTKREFEILQQLAEGRSSEEISAKLFISKQTVDTHRKNLLKKTACTNTAELMSLAVKKGWI
ncbi:MAG: PAS domain-containing protein [Niastella sp.]|nr:PAS domain-containing protein [Niastella sp.]